MNTGDTEPGKAAEQTVSALTKPPRPSPSAAVLREGDYERPQQAWRCGHSDGNTCRLGPDPNGRCQAGPMCRPRKDKDRWRCTRPKSAGGPCADGPDPEGGCSRTIQPCTPQPTLRTVRGRVIRWGLALTLGLLILALHGPGREDILSPGPVSIHHATIDDCSNCHGGFNDGPTAWAVAAINPSQRHPDGELCLSCHKLGEFPFSPHAQPPQSLTERRRIIADRQGGESPETPPFLMMAAALHTPEDPLQGAIACRTCHHEHRGTDANLTLVSNADCQMCHSLRFGGIGDGHPDIRYILSGRRQRIKFDHNAHFDRHFADGKVTERAPETCIDCHKPGPQGRTITMVAFEQGCADCHAAEITGATATGRKGIAVLTAPGLDLFELEDRGIEIGTWPEFSEEPITPFLETMLRHDPKVAAALDRIEGLNLLDLRPASAEEVAAAATVAVAVKSLFAHLLSEGLMMGKDLLADAKADRPDQSAGTLLALLPFEVLQAAQTAWFPGLPTETARSLPILPDPISGPANGTEPPHETGGANGKRDQGDILNGSTDDSDDILGGGGDDILGGGGSDDILGGGGDDILGGGGGDDILGGGGSNDILGGGGSNDILGGYTDDPDAAEGSGDAAQPPATLEPSVSLEEWMALGGWYRQDSALLYRPSGHADPFLRAWLDIAVARSGADKSHDGSEMSDLGARLMAAIGTEKAPGTCLRCHSVETPGPDTAAEYDFINWYADRPDPNNATFTDFSHAEHFSLVDKKGCEHCHALTHEIDRDAFAAQYAVRDATAKVAPNFLGPNAEECAVCHTPEAAGDDCTLCHNYHVGRFPPRMPRQQPMAASDIARP